jgi:general secretion pathway protein G
MACALAVIFIVVCNSRADPAPDPLTRVKSDIEAIGVQLKLYQAMNGFLPTTAQGLQALVTQPATDPKPLLWRRLLDKVPTDPWGKPYFYVQPGKHHPGFDLYSAGPDRKPDTDDDIGNW